MEIIRTILRKFGKLWRSSGHPLSRTALKHGAAPSFEHAEILRGLGRLQTLVDVGANVGQFSMLCRMIQPQAKIYAFEPLEKAAETFGRVLAREENITLYRFALGSTESEATINVTARADSSSLFVPAAQAEVFPGTHSVRSESVRVMALHDVLSSSDLMAPSLLKIDVQGYEGEVLKGCESLLHAFDWIYCEASFIELYKGQPMANEIIDWLSARGFSLVSVNSDSSVLRDGRAVQADFLFCRDELPKLNAKH